MSVFDKIRGTYESIIQLGKGGPNLKNNAGVIEARNATDGAFAKINAAPPTTGDNVANQTFVTTTRELGKGSGGLNDIAIGTNTQLIVTTGNADIAIGVNAQSPLTTGNSNIAIGVGAQSSLVNGDINIAIGSQAQASLISGIQNIAIGYNSQANATGSNNVAVGVGTQDVMTTGVFNTAVGDNAQGALTTGILNTSVGYNAASALTTGSENASVGDNSLVTLTSGSGNAALGRGAGPSIATLNSTLCLGYGATVSASNKAAIGGIGANAVDVGIGVIDAQAKLHLDKGNATAVAMKFTAGATTGITATDGFDVGITTTGEAEIRQRENLDIVVYTNNTEHIRFFANGATTGLVQQNIANIAKAASANIRNSRDTEETTTSAVYILLESIRLTYGLIGQAKILFDMKTSNVAVTAYAKIYRNGVPLGIEQTDITGVYATKSEDITQNWSPNDYCELWAHIDGVETVSVQNFRIAYDDAPVVAVASVNS